MKRKMYILRTWMWDVKSEEATPVEPLKVRHPTKLTVYIAEPLVDPIPGGVPYITTSRLSAKKFYIDESKKDSIPLGWNMNCFQFLLK